MAELKYSRKHVFNRVLAYVGLVVPLLYFAKAPLSKVFEESADDLVNKHAIKKAQADEIKASYKEASKFQVINGFFIPAFLGAIFGNHDAEKEKREFGRREFLLTGVRMAALSAVWGRVHQAVEEDQMTKYHFGNDDKKEPQDFQMQLPKDLPDAVKRELISESSSELGRAAGVSLLAGQFVHFAAAYDWRVKTKAPRLEEDSLDHIIRREPS